MRTSLENLKSVRPRRSLLPASFGFMAVAMVFVVPLVTRQQKEVMVSVYAAWISIMGLVAMFAFSKSRRRGAAIAAALVCAVFGSLCAVYVHLIHAAQT